MGRSAKGPLNVPGSAVNQKAGVALGSMDAFVAAMSSSLHPSRGNGECQMRNIQCSQTRSLVQPH
jgi:hypothetical protein